MFLNSRSAIALVLFTMCVAAHAQEIIGAVWSGDIGRVETLLADGANINETTRNGLTPLMFAASRGEYDIAVTLIDSGANIDAASAEKEFTFTEDGPSIIAGVTALMIAIIREDGDIVNLLLEKGADINIEAESDYTALSFAIATGNTHIISQLLNQDPIVSGKRGVTAISEAVINRNELVVKELLKRGVDADSISTASDMGLGLSNSHLTSRGDSLLTNAVKENAKYDKLPGNTVSQLRLESDKIVLHLLKNKADPNFQNMDGQTALIITAQQGRTRTMELLLGYGADPNIQENDFGSTALMNSVRSCRLYDSKLLIANGADPNIQNNEGQTSLNIAQRLYVQGVGCAHIVAYLESIGAKHPLSKNIFEAAKFGDLNKVQQFIREGADVNSIDEDGAPVLFSALDSGQIDIIEELLKAGADVNTSGDIGITPLMISVDSEREDILKLLIKYGADINVQDAFVGHTPLILSVIIERADILKLLIKHGADINAQDALGRTAASHAKEIGNMEALEILRKAGAKIK